MVLIKPQRDVFAEARRASRWSAPEPWFGGRCPVGSQTLVQVRLRDELEPDAPAPAEYYRWDWRDEHDDVVEWSYLDEY